MSVDPTTLDPATVQALLQGTRWFAADTEKVDRAEVVEVVLEDGPLALVVVAVVGGDGSESRYQLALALDGDRPRDALERPDLVAMLCRRCGVEAAGTTVQPMGVEQSNSTVLLDGRHVVKLYRRLEQGTQPELELLTALSAAGFASMPRLDGSLTVRGMTLAVVTGLVPARADGWNTTLEELAAGPGWLPGRAARLGDVTARMHAALATALEPPRRESRADLDRLAASISNGLQELAGRVPAAGEAARLAAELAAGAAPGQLIRVHGDYHLGQVLWSDELGWIVIDFEGEPDRSLADRRDPRSPFVDLAGMTRSFDYVVDGAPRLVGVELPGDWLDACVDAFLSAYLAAVPPDLLPPSRDDVERRLALHELERLGSELRYELVHRPEWVEIPAAGLQRLLDRRIGR